ncbi:MAG TPA: HlyD family secretion protein [Victivallales bacterium]|nr:HlyD family secretion protein [Victivallales bacterium]
MNALRIIKNKKFWIGVAIMLIVSIGCLGYYIYAAYYPSTDDAYIKANIVGISPYVSGKIDKVYVVDNEFVKKGTLLVKIEQKPYKLAVNKAEADVNQAKQDVKLSKTKVQVALSNYQECKAKMTFASQTYRRYKLLNKTKAVSDQLTDQAYADYKITKSQSYKAVSLLEEAKEGIKVAESELKEANSEHENANFNLTQTTIYAPSDGYVSNFNINHGEYVSTGEKLFAFIDSKAWWVRAEFKETDMKRIHPGQKVKVHVDMYNEDITGTVESLGYGSGVTFSLLPPENGTGNWVKVTQRFPIRIKINNPKNNLRVGSSVEVTVDTVS